MTATAAIVALLAVVGLWLLGIHLVGEWTLTERVSITRRWFRWFWCALRDHPYPKITAARDYGEPMITWAPPVCSNCGASIEPRGRNTHS